MIFYVIFSVADDGFYSLLGEGKREWNWMSYGIILLML